MNEELKIKLTAEFKAEVSDVVNSYSDEDNGDAVDLLEETDFHGLTIGWAMAKGLNPSEAYDFATYIRYNTDLA